jgi:hypothetical protein
MAILCFQLAAVRIKSGITAAKTTADELEARVRRIAQPELDPFWAAILGIIHEIAEGNGNWRTLYEAGVEWEQKSETQLGVMYRLAALMTAGPDNAFHLTMHSFRRKLIPWAVDTPYHTIVVPFLKDYWRWTVEHCPACFSVPERTARELESAMSIAGELGLQKGLEVVARSLGVTLTPDYKEYLSEKTNQPGERALEA